MITSCSIEVMPAPPGGVIIWCDTCKERVAFKQEFTVDEIVATTAGHQRVMRAAREASW